MPSAPNQGVIDKWQAELTGKGREYAAREAASPLLSGARPVVPPAPAAPAVGGFGAAAVHAGAVAAHRIATRAVIGQQQRYDLHQRQIKAIIGAKKKIPKRPYHAGAMSQVHKYT
jgi:hypothetical protein